jgi:aminopeptidase N
MKMPKQFIIIFSITALASCIKPVKDPEYSSTNPKKDTVPSNEKPEPHQLIYNPAATRINDIEHTRLDVSFDYRKKRLNGVATIDIRPYFYPVNSVKLDAKNFDIHSIQLITSTGNKPLRYQYNNMEIDIELDRYYTRTERYRLRIEYTAKPDERPMGGSAAISGDKGLYFINTDSTETDKHVEIWTQGETESNSAWFPTIDKPNEKMTHEILITVPDAFETLSNGVLSGSVKNANGTRTDHWKMTQPHAPYLVMMTIGDFAIVKDSWKRKNGQQVEVSYYVEKEFEQYARDIFGKTPRMIEFFSNLLGVEYPWEKYAQVVVRDYVSGAMENTTATIHGEFLYRTRRELIDGNNESIIAHELFHHWFGDLVTCESWANLPLNESFANYSQYLWDEFEYGADEADHFAYRELNGYFNSSRQNGFADMIRYNYHDKEEMFDAHSYNKGGRILHMLRNEVGDTAFFTALKVYLTENSFKPAEMHQLRLAFEQVTGRDLNWFYNQWFFAKGHPVLKITHAYNQADANTRVIVEQKQDFAVAPLYIIPVEIDIYTEGGKMTHSVKLKNRIDTFNLKTNGVPLLVNFDSRKVILCEKEEEKPVAQWIYQYRNGTKYLDRREALEHCSVSEDPNALKIILEAMGDRSRHIREIALRMSKKVYGDFTSETRSVLTELSLNDKASNVRTEAIRQLSKLFPSDASLLYVYEKAIQDSSYNIASAGLNGLAKIDAKQAMSICNSMENEENATVKNAIADIYSKFGGTDQHEFFKENIKKITGFEKFAFLNSYLNFLLRQSDDEIDKGIVVFEDLARNGKPWWLKYSGYQKLIALQKHYKEKIEALSVKEAGLRKEGNQVDADQALREINLAKAQEKKIAKLVETLKAQETDKNVLQYLNK